MAKNREEEWVEVAATGQDEEATLISGMLTAAGIENEVEAPHGSSALPENLGSFGMSRVVVPPSQVEEAKSLLADADARGKRQRAGDEGGDEE